MIVQVLKMDFVKAMDFVNLFPANITHNQLNLMLYSVRDMEMCSTMVNGKEAITVLITLTRQVLITSSLTITLFRPIISIMLTVLIPTSVLLAISYLSRCPLWCYLFTTPCRVFQEEFFDTVLQVNLTVLLVQATL